MEIGAFLVMLALSGPAPAVGAEQLPPSRPTDSMMPTEPIAEIKAPFAMPELKRPHIPNRSVNITDYGAKPGKGHDNTKAIKRAIGDCAAMGGGAVAIPKGDWHTGPIHLKSKINLHLQDGAALYFLPDASLYLPPVLTRNQGTDVYNFSPMIYARDCSNIAITGHGKLYGPDHGIEDAATHHRSWNAWRASQHRLGIAAGVPIKQSAIGKFTWGGGLRILENFARNTSDIEKRDGAATYRLDPSLIQPIHCRNVLIEGIMIARGGPMWTIHPAYCTNVIIRNIAVHTIGTANDAINPSSCENVLIERCDIASGDDCVALKSGIDEEGWRVNRPDRNIVIRHINGISAHAGGISIGTELSGGIENVYCHDNHMNTPNPFRIKSRPGRGAVVRNVTCERFTSGGTHKPYTDWKFPDKIHKSPTRALIELSNNYGVMSRHADKTKVTVFENITIREFSGEKSGTGIKLSSRGPGTFRNIVIDKVTLKHGGVGYKGNLPGVRLTNYVLARKIIKGNGEKSSKP